VVDTHDLRKYMKLKHEVLGAKWDEERGVWEVEIKDLNTGTTFTDTAEVFINGGGVLKYVSHSLYSLNK
jgi:cation diffusion facilitator CzcD-associated flavoprotein CzcO